jgi:prepilin peptidase CpaA
MTQPAFYLLVFTVLLTGIAAVWDLRTGTIPNRLVVIGALSGLALRLGLAAASGEALTVLRALGGSVVGVALVSLVPLFLYRAGGIGGGDVKLLAVVGALLGPYPGLEVELYAFTATLIYAPARLIWDGSLVAAMRTIGQLVVTPFVPRGRRKPMATRELTSFRFGPAIFAGAVLTAGLQGGGLA